MDRERFVVSDTVWEKIEPLLAGKKSDRGVTAKDNRLFLEAVLWRVRAGLPWRDLPAEFGNWNSPEFAVHRHGDTNTLIQHAFLPKKMTS